MVLHSIINQLSAQRNVTAVLRMLAIAKRDAVVVIFGFAPSCAQRWRTVVRIAAHDGSQSGVKPMRFLMCNARVTICARLQSVRVQFIEGPPFGVVASG